MIKITGENCTINGSDNTIVIERIQPIRPQEKDLISFFNSLNAKQQFKFMSIIYKWRDRINNCVG